jgi:hypothetical protein
MPATPTLSDALAVTVIVPETVEPDEGDVMLTVGGVVSVTVMESETVAPDAGDVMVVSTRLPKL